MCKVGDGRVMEALDRGLQTMKKGEHAKFVVEARHAYGEAGSEALQVPPDSAVILEVELVKCPLREDLFGDGGAIKLEVKDCPNARMPRVGDECTVSYKAPLPKPRSAHAAPQSASSCRLLRPTSLGPSCPHRAHPDRATP